MFKRLTDILLLMYYLIIQSIIIVLCILQIPLAPIYYILTGKWIFSILENVHEKYAYKIDRLNLI